MAPCWECGADPCELEHLAEGRHTYAECLVFDSPIILCDFCMVDFGSFTPAYFGRTHRVYYGKGVTLIRDVPNPQTSKDKYCEQCGQRLAYLRFLVKVREGGREEE